ncbi:MAG: Outer membrane efflux protein [Deltaproteobacteria bacterium ADurb.Bin510]|nr:MAG: Outer membrane efflux protein [Deltaproteobacteria bacterium ADurb.Bin510]
MSEGREQVKLAELGLRQARENRELAQGRYASGVGSAVEVTDALTSELEAQRALSTAQYEYRLAEASLAKATGAEQ